MKRFISLACVALILVTILSVPVQAAEVSNNGPWVDLLDFSTINDSGSNFLMFTDSTTFTIKTPEDMPCLYVDIILYIASGAVPTSFQVHWLDNRYELNIESIGNGYYRIYGSMRYDIYSLVWFTLRTSNPTEFCYYQFCSIRVTGAQVHFNENAYASGYWGESGHKIEMVIDSASSTSRYQYIDTSSTAINSEYWFEVNFPNWKKYDYIDLVVAYRGLNITSISAYFENYGVPLTTSFVDSGVDSETYYLVTCRIDISGLSKSSDMLPCIRFTGQLAAQEVNYLQLMVCSGSIDVQRSDLYYYFRNLNLNLGNLFSTLNSTISGNFSSLQTWIQNQTSSIQTQFSQLKSSISSHFSNLNTWIDNQTSRLESAIRGDSSAGSEIIEGAQEIESGVNDIGQFEKDQQAVLDNNFNTIQASVDISSFANGFQFVLLCSNMIFEGMGDYTIVFMLPLFLGIFFFICSKVPGATRWKSRPPKDGDT